MYEISQSALNPNDLYGVYPDGVRFIPQMGMGCGMGCAGMGGLSMDGSGLFGTGVFGTGVTATDVSTWSVAEYGAVAFGLLVVFSLASTGKQTVQSVRKFRRRRAA